MFIDLIDVSSFFGFIYPCSSGVFWSNQTGGTMCAHSEVEGIFVPLNPNWLPESDPLISWWGNYDSGMVQSFLDRHESLARSFRPLDDKELTNHQIVSSIMEETDGHMQFGEAWIPVMVQDFPDDPIRPFANKLVIITYENSD